MPLSAFRTAVLDRLPAAPIDELLEDLNALKERAQRDEPVHLPHLTVHMTSGTALAGRLVDLRDNRGHRSIALALTADPTTPSDQIRDVAHIDVARIEAVVVHDAAACAYHMTEGEIGFASGNLGLDPSVVAEIASDYARRLETRLGHPVDVKAETAEADTIALGYLVNVLNDVTGIVIAMSADYFTRSRLARELRAIVVRPGHVEVSFSDGCLEVSAPVCVAEDRPSRHALRDMISEACA